MSLGVVELLLLGNDLLAVHNGDTLIAIVHALTTEVVQQALAINNKNSVPVTRYAVCSIVEMQGY